MEGAAGKAWPALTAVVAGKEEDVKEETEREEGFSDSDGERGTDEAKGEMLGSVSRGMERWCCIGDE